MPVFQIVLIGFNRNRMLWSTVQSLCRSTSRRSWREELSGEQDLDFGTSTVTEARKKWPNTRSAAKPETSKLSDLALWGLLPAVRLRVVDLQEVHLGAQEAQRPRGLSGSVCGSGPAPIGGGRMRLDVLEDAFEVKRGNVLARLAAPAEPWHLRFDGVEVCWIGKSGGEGRAIGGPRLSVPFGPTAPPFSSRSVPAPCHGCCQAQL